MEILDGSLWDGRLTSSMSQASPTGRTAPGGLAGPNGRTAPASLAGPTRRTSLKPGTPVIRRLPKLSSLWGRMGKSMIVTTPASVTTGLRGETRERYQSRRLREYHVSDSDPNLEPLVQGGSAREPSRATPAARSITSPPTATRISAPATAAATSATGTSTVFAVTFAVSLSIAASENQIYEYRACE